MSARARAADIKGQTSGMPAAYLRCRTRGHAWDFDKIEAINKREIRLTDECARCGATSWRSMTLRGSITGSGSTYPEGYLLHDTGRLSTDDRDVIRAAFVNDLLKAA